MNRNEYILKLKSLKSIIDKQLLIESENDKWYNAHSSEVQEEINFCKHCKTASPKELQSHLESASKLLTEENYKVLKEIGPKVKVGSPKQADYLNKATKALKKISEKVKNNYHLESVKMSNQTKYSVIIAIILILISIILLVLQGNNEHIKKAEEIRQSLLDDTNKEGAIDSLIKMQLHYQEAGLCLVPGILGLMILVDVYLKYRQADSRNNFLSNTMYKAMGLFKNLEGNVYYY
jgi:hypothetical protein